MVNDVSCKPRRTNLGQTGFVTNKAGTKQTIWLPPWGLFETEYNYSAAAHVVPQSKRFQHIVAAFRLVDE